MDIGKLLTYVNHLKAEAAAEDLRTIAAQQEENLKQKETVRDVQGLLDDLELEDTICYAEIDPQAYDAGYSEWVDALDNAEGDSGPTVPAHAFIEGTPCEVEVYMMVRADPDLTEAQSYLYDA